MIYLDNAATTSPKPRSVIRAVGTALEKYSANPGRAGHTLSLDTAQMIYETREKLAELFGAASAENVVFTSSCTAALNTVIGGLFQAGEHVIISSLEHNAVSRSVKNQQLNHGVDFSVARVSGNEQGAVREFAQLIRPNTRAIICMHASNVFGIPLPIARLGQLCRERGLLFIVDAAQTAGIMPIDCSVMNIDYLCIAPHKGLYAPMGLGVLISDSAPRPLIFGGTGSSSALQTQPDFTPDKYESGTLNVPAICGLSAGIDFIRSIGIEKLYTHELELITRAYTALAALEGVRLYTPPPERGDAPVLSFNIGDIPSEQIAQRLNTSGIAVRAGLHCSPFAHSHADTLRQGTVRIAPSAFTTPEQIDLLLAAVKEIIE